MVVVSHGMNDNPEPAEFLKWNNPPSIFGTVHDNFSDIKKGTRS